MEKLTDNEIIKAWEKILSTGDAPIGEHWSCGGVVTTKLAKETFDMLNRQKAEIERLKQNIEETHADTKEHFETFKIEQQAEIENLNIELQAMRGAANSYKREVKRLENAYKQCAWERDMFLEELNTTKSETYKGTK